MVEFQELLKSVDDLLLRVADLSSLTRLEGDASREIDEKMVELKKTRALVK